MLLPRGGPRCSVAGGSRAMVACAWLVTLVEGSRVVQAWPGRVTMAKHAWDAAEG